MKVIKSGKINPFGGINFVLESFNQLGISKLLNRQLPTLTAQCKYDWKDIFYSFWSIFFCGGDCIEDINHNLKFHLSNNFLIDIPSPDRILERFKSLSLPQTHYHQPKRKVDHYYCVNPRLNDLLIKIAKQTKLLNAKDLTLDYDNTIVVTKKSDSKKTYIKEFGYQPGVAFINNLVVFVENRNGNTQAQTFQEETMIALFAQLEINNIKVKRFRADGASYQLNLIKLLEQKVKYFYIRARKSITISRLISKIDEWKEVELNGHKAYRAEINYTPFIGKTARINQIKDCDLNEYRLIITKTKRKDGQIDLYTNEDCIYRCILTNDTEMTMDEVVEFYNQRGSVEKQFDVLKNDFGWKNMPFSKLEQNNTFLIITAICKNLYEYIIRSYSIKNKFLSATFRIKKFIFRFIAMPSKWIKQGRIFKLRIYSNINFET